MDFAAVTSIVIPEGAVSSISCAGKILWQKIRLPEEYQQVMYLESTGTEYINTGFTPNENSKMYLDFYPTVKQSKCYAGCRNNDTYAKFTINSGKSNRLQYGGLGESGNVELGDHTVGRHTVSIEKGVFTYDGVETVVTAEEIETLNALYTVYLFACNTKGPTLQASCRIYSCKIWDDGIMIRDFVPCVRKSDNKPGMYDLVNKGFRTNAGSGEFLYA